VALAIVSAVPVVPVASTIAAPGADVMLATPVRAALANVPLPEPETAEAVAAEAAAAVAEAAALVALVAEAAALAALAAL
jgi:hypothetical protein